MKCTIPEISWHNKEPVLSVDIHPDSNPFYRLATGGGDCHVLIWQVITKNNGAVQQEVISDLKRHQRSVNAVKWSPTGTYLASADDDANIIVWQLKTDNIPSLDDETNDKEIWNVFKVLRGHKEDIYDLCWSPNSLKLLSGSIDNTAIIWDVQKGKNEHIITDHKGFVQGVAWDPKNQYLATICTDRICRLFDNTGKHVKLRISRGIVPKNNYLIEKEIKYFHDDTFKSFFRRLSFSPDGSVLVVPSGQLSVEDGKGTSCTYLFPVDASTPAAIFPMPKQCSVVVKFCPMYFELRKNGPEPYINLPYRMVFAIGTDHDVVLYDTQQQEPFARFHNIHYTRLTDLTWSSDGLLLIASSTDGFCTIITFESEELGIQYVKEESEVEENINNISLSEPISDNTITKKNDVTEKPVISILTPKRVKKPTIPENNASILSFFKKTNESNKESETSVNENKSMEIDTNVIEVDDSSDDKKENDIKAGNSTKPSRRIVPSKIS